jgi:large subunit ribosomal protein L18
MIDKRTQRIRTKLKKVSSRNRLSVFRSNNHIYAQAIDDSKGITLASASTLEKN